MTETQSRIPRLIASAVVRGAERGDSHGGIDQQLIARVNFSMAIRIAIHGLEVRPFD